MTAVRPVRIDPFRLPRELDGGVPRDVRLTAGGVTLTTFAVLLAVGAIVVTAAMSIAYSRDESARKRRALEGVAAQGEIVDIATRRGEHPRRVVSYRYEVEGRTYEDRVTLRERDRRTLTRGDRLPIHYVRSAPQDSWVAGYEPDGFPLPVIPLAAISMLFVAWMMSWIVRREWTLLTEGRAAKGRVLSSKKISHGSHGGSHNRVRYEFVAISGATYTGHYDVSKNPPPPGSFVPVVYHRDRPQWNTAYPMQFVRAARS